jgi:hypothetical protein
MSTNLSFEKASFKDVGCMAISACSSYNMNLENFQSDGLGGREVQIMSRPFKLIVMTYSRKLKEVEFVIVKDQHQIVRVMNTFKTIKRK